MTRSDPPETSCAGHCCKLIFISGVIIFFVWFNLRATNPTFSIEQFYASTLNNTSNYTYDLKLNNKNKEKGIYYDALNLTFYYNPNLTLIGNASYPAFYQGHHKKAHRVGNLEPGPGLNRGNGTGLFRVELATAVRFKIVFWKTKRRRFVVGADLEVNDEGRLVKGKKNKGIKMTSQAAMIKRMGWLHWVGFLWTWAFIHFC